jgi:hypothetical protein
VSAASPARQRRASRSPAVQTSAERQLRQDLTRLVNELVEDAVQRALAKRPHSRRGQATTRAVWRHRHSNRTRHH